MKQSEVFKEAFSFISSRSKVLWNSHKRSLKLLPIKCMWRTIQSQTSWFPWTFPTNVPQWRAFQCARSFAHNRHRIWCREYRTIKLSAVCSPHLGKNYLRVKAKISEIFFLIWIPWNDDALKKFPLRWNVFPQSTHACIVLQLLQDFELANVCFYN